MRFFILAAIAFFPATSTVAQRPATQKALEDLGLVRSDCPPTAAQQVARQIRQGQPPLFHRLVPLPPATAYQAVVREIDGCEVPLTVIEYRTGRRP